jgi:hypothetical protein
MDTGLTLSSEPWKASSWCQGPVGFDLRPSLINKSTVGSGIVLNNVIQRFGNDAGIISVPPIYVNRPRSEAT